MGTSIADQTGAHDPSAVTTVSSVLARAWRDRRLRIAAKASAAVALVLIVAYNLVGLPGLRPFGIHYRIDLGVYRSGGTLWRHGTDLYGQIPSSLGGGGLPFTYPPLSAVIFGPFSVMSMGVASITITAATILALAATVALFAWALGARGDALAWITVAVTAAALLLEPVRSTLDFGQVNVVLMALVAADVLLPRTFWPRGTLIGLVTAVKLTPAVFVLYFLVRRQWRPAVTSVISFLVFSGIGFLCAGTDSTKYWTDVVFDSSRIGGVAYVSNQSIHGVLTRLDLGDHAASLWWVAASLAAVAVGVYAMVRSCRVGQYTLALAVNAIVGLLVSPISWTHHWVWIAPALMILATVWWRTREHAIGWLAAAGMVLFFVAPQWRLPQGDGRELRWAWWEHLLGSVYVWWGLAAVVTVAVVAPKLTATRPGVEPTAAAPTRGTATA